ncbi:MAG TPA: HU family DNA-binding protein [Patescibacteria group bacterium]|nr:HU family DNA-binding protein [Patescibacteria group bacterium]
MSVTKKELIELVAKKGNLTNKAAKEAIKVFLNGIRDSLKRNEKVVITGFGTFSLRARKSRKGRNPKTGETITIAARKAPGFTPGKSLKKAVK